VPAHDHYVAFSLGEIGIGRTIDVPAAERAAHAELRGSGADQVTQPPVAVIALGTAGRLVPR
jgi:hypothetical protein